MKSTPASPPALVKALRSSELFLRVALKHWSETQGVALVWLDAGEALQAEVNSRLIGDERLSESRLVAEIAAVLGEKLKFPTEGVELSGFEDFDAEPVPVQCPAGFFLFVPLKDSRAGARPGDNLSHEDLLSQLHEDWTYVVLTGGSVDWLTWAAKPDATMIVRVAATAWRGGGGTFQAVADALNEQGLTPLTANSVTENRPFRADTVAAVITAVELIEGSPEEAPSTSSL